MKPQEFEVKIANLNVSLFERIESQTSVNDKKSLLAMQKIVRSCKDPYIYLEIGSHLGGSIQPHLLDHKCCKIFSIDKRPLVQPDERWAEGYEYFDNSTQRMLDNLKGLVVDLGKITCFDSDASDIDKNRIIPRPDICFIDGEHTNRKVISDFQFCRSVLSDSGVIIFHDADIITEGIGLIIKSLSNTAKFKAYYLPDGIFVLDFMRDDMRFEKIRSEGVKVYILHSFMEILRRKCRQLPLPLKTSIKSFLKFFRLI